MDSCIYEPFQRVGRRMGMKIQQMAGFIQYWPRGVQPCVNGLHQLDRSLMVLIVSIEQAHDPPAIDEHVSHGSSP